MSNDGLTGIWLLPRRRFIDAARLIWQTVWLEPVPTSTVESLHAVPKPAACKKWGHVSTFDSAEKAAA
jgi:hypothetical protein